MTIRRVIRLDLDEKQAKAVGLAILGYRFTVNPKSGMERFAALDMAPEVFKEWVESLNDSEILLSDGVLHDIYRALTT